MPAQIGALSSLSVSFGSGHPWILR